MRSLIISILLFSLLVGAIVVNSIYVSNLCRDISELAEALSISDERELLITNMKEKWQKHRPFLDFGIRTGEIEHMNDLMEGLYASHEAKNEPEFQKYCILISELADEFAAYEKISLRSLC